MALLGLPERDRLLEYNCIDLLPGLEDDVFCSEAEIHVIENEFVSGIDDWWPAFVADTCL